MTTIPIKSWGIAIACSLLAGCNFGVRGSGTTVTKNREVGEFSNVKITGGCDAMVTIGEITTVAVTTDDNLQQFVETSTDGDTLEIRTTGFLRSTNGVKAEITVPLLSSVRVSGSGDITVHGLEQDRFHVKISGSGGVHATGTIDVVDVEVSGSGDIKLRELLAKNVKIRISGSGDAVVNATESLDAKVSGSGDIRYVDHPGLKADTKVSGSGDVSTI